MKRVFKTRQFARWMRKTTITDETLCIAVSEMNAGLIDVDLGGSIFKKRIPLPGKGKRVSSRVLVATRRSGIWVFVFGFNKNDRENITKVELGALRVLAQRLLSLSPTELSAAMDDGVLEEICHEC